MWNKTKKPKSTHIDPSTEEDLWVIENTLIYISFEKHIGTIRVSMYPKKDAGNPRKLLVRFIRIEYPYESNRIFVLGEYYDPLCVFEEDLGTRKVSVRKVLPELMDEWIRLLRQEKSSGCEKMQTRILELRGVKESLRVAALKEFLTIAALKKIAAYPNWETPDAVSALYTPHTPWTYHITFQPVGLNDGAACGTLVVMPDNEPSLPYLVRDVQIFYSIQGGKCMLYAIREKCDRKSPIELLCGSSDYTFMKSMPLLMPNFKRNCIRNVDSNVIDDITVVVRPPDVDYYPQNLFQLAWREEDAHPTTILADLSNKQPEKIIYERAFAEEAAGLLYSMAPGHRPRNIEVIMNRALDTFRVISEKVGVSYTWRIYDKKEYFPTLNGIFFNIPEFVELYLSNEDIRAGMTVNDLERGFEGFRVDYVEDFQSLNLHAYLHELASRLWPRYNRED